MSQIGDRHNITNSITVCQVDRCLGEVMSHFNGILIKTPCFIITVQSKMLFMRIKSTKRRSENAFIEVRGQIAIIMSQK